jgi:hypothetical protein
MMKLPRQNQRKHTLKTADFITFPAIKQMCKRIKKLLAQELDGVPSLPFVGIVLIAFM